MLFEAINEIDEQYIESAQNRLGYEMLFSGYEDSSPYTARQKRSASIRRVYIGVAAAIMLLLATFITAMASSEGFRQAVFAFFSIRTPDVISPIEDEPETSKAVENIYEATIDDAVTVEYIKKALKNR